jgi:hypothetical protein
MCSSHLCTHPLGVKETDFPTQIAAPCGIIIASGAKEELK